MSRHVTSYHVESRGTITRPTLHCQLTFSTRNTFKLSMTVLVGCPEGCRYHTASAVYDLVNSTAPIVNSIPANALVSTLILGYPRCHTLMHGSNIIAHRLYDCSHCTIKKIGIEAVPKSTSRWTAGCNIHVTVYSTIYYLFMLCQTIIRDLHLITKSSSSCFKYYYTIR